MDFLRNDNVLLAEREEIIDKSETINETFAMMESCDELFATVNYDVQKERAERENLIENILNEIDGKSLTEEEIMPTSETMRYKKTESLDLSDIEVVDDGFTFGLRKRDKMLIAVYSVVVMLILSLIVLNTGIINTIQAKLNERTESIATLTQEYSQIVNEIETVSSDDYVINKAVNEYNMSK